VDPGLVRLLGEAAVDDAAGDGVAVLKDEQRRHVEAVSRRQRRRHETRVDHRHADAGAAQVEVQRLGEVLQRLYWLAYAMSAVMFVSLTLHRLLGARPIKYGIRTGILAFMLAATLSADYYVGPRIAAVQGQVSGPVASLAADHPLRLEFNRLHGLANILLSLAAVGGLALLFWEARE
jgi:hypothetical protein